MVVFTSMLAKLNVFASSLRLRRSAASGHPPAAAVELLGKVIVINLRASTATPEVDTADVEVLVVVVRLPSKLAKARYGSWRRSTVVCSTPWLLLKRFVVLHSLQSGSFLPIHCCISFFPSYVFLLLSDSTLLFVCRNLSFHHCFHLSPTILYLQLHAPPIDNKMSYYLTLFRTLHYIDHWPAVTPPPQPCHSTPKYSHVLLLHSQPHISPSHILPPPSFHHAIMTHTFTYTHTDILYLHGHCTTSCIVSSSVSSRAHTTTSTSPPLPSHLSYLLLVP